MKFLGNKWHRAESFLLKGEREVPIYMGDLKTIDSSPLFLKAYIVKTKTNQANIKG